MTYGKWMMTAALATGLGATTVMGAAFTPGNLAVSRVGDGATALVNTGGPISVLEYTTAGSLVQTISIPSGNGGLQLSGTATSEGALALSQNGQSLTIAGYIPPFSGTGSIANRTDAEAPRGYVSIGNDGTVGTPVAIGAYSGNNIRAAVESNTGTYFAGGNTGTIYRTGTTNTTVQTTVTNTRVVNIINDRLYFSTGAGNNRGVWAFDTALPTAASTASVVIDLGAAASPYDFAFNSAGNVAYVTNATEIQRWAFDGTAWSKSHTATGFTNLTGLAVSFGTTSDTLYTVNPTTLFSLVFDGTSFGTASTLATAGTNYAFRGLEFAPVPEPTSLTLLGLGGLGLMARRRRA